MKRQMTLAAMTLVNSLRSTRPSGRPSGLRRALSLTLILTLVIVPLLSGRTTITPPAQAQIGACGGAGRIFQGCPLSGPYETSLENQALDDLLNVHQLPAGDRGRLLGWQRGELRTLLYNQLLGAIKKAPGARTADEQAAVNAFAARIKQTRIEAAQFAVDEYNSWQSSPCTYGPPAGFSYPGRQLCAAGRLNPAVAGPIDPPKFEEFQAYGVARAFRLLQDLRTQRTMDQVVRGVAFFGGVVVSGITGAVVALNISTSVVSAIFPFASRAFAIGASAGVAAGLGSATAAIGGAAFVVVAAIVIGVLRGIDVANIAALPGKLQDKLNEMRNAPPPDLAQLITTTTGQQEVFAVFTLMTLPDFPATDPVPAAQASDPQFRVRQDGSATTTTAATIDFKSWNNDNQSARLNGGWFINKYKFEFL